MHRKGGSIQVEKNMIWRVLKLKNNHSAGVE